MKKLDNLLCCLGLHRYGRYLDVDASTWRQNSYTLICKRCGKAAA